MLKPGGVYVQISFGQPHFRIRNYFGHEKYGWTVAHSVFGACRVLVRRLCVPQHDCCCRGAGTGFGYFFYTMHKADAKSAGGATGASSAKGSESKGVGAGVS